MNKHILQSILNNLHFLCNQQQQYNVQFLGRVPIYCVEKKHFVIFPSTAGYSTVKCCSLLRFSISYIKITIYSYITNTKPKYCKIHIYTHLRKT